MKIILVGLILLLSLSQVVYAAESDEAKSFAGEYAAEVRQELLKSAAARQESAHTSTVQVKKRVDLTVDTRAKGGVVSYKERYPNLSSRYKYAYSEGLVSAAVEVDKAVYAYVDFFGGSAFKDTEKWYFAGNEFQTNKMKFYRLGTNVRVGKIFFSDIYTDFKATPFVTYGYRYTDFKRSDFNILGAPLNIGAVSEKYYVHHVGGGVTFDKRFNRRFGISGFGLYSYVFYNQADNSTFGKIDGDGGSLTDAGLDFNYYFTDNFKLKLGGFFELQELNGKNNNVVIWPDNKTMFYGGQVGLQAVF